MNFEEIMNHPGKNLTSNDLTNSIWHDEIILIRAIEYNKEEIIKDPEILFPSKTDLQKIKIIYKDYCSTAISVERDEHGEIIDFPNISITRVGEAIDLAFLHS